jgi:sodium transport system ATP-binding protein
MSEQAIAARTAELITQLDLSEFIDRRVESYSTGMKQRVSIARTVVHDPEVLILDEPTLGLDVMASRNIITFVRDCRARGKTIIYSTHVMSEATKLCDTIGILHRGRIVAEGSLAELQARYALEDLEDIFVSALGGEGENTL